MWRQAIAFTCGIAQEKLVNRGVEYVLESLSGKENRDSDLENMESNFKSLMGRAHDLDKEINIRVQHGRRKRKREVEVWFEDVKRVEREYGTFVEEEERRGFIKKIFGGDEATKLNARICDLVNRSQYFGELVLVDDTTSTVGMPRPTTELEGAAFHNNIQTIWNLLESDKVSSIGIYGMGGVGKSTLVEHIHNQLLERNKCLAWIAVGSQRCSIEMLQDKIARKLGLDLSDEDEDDVGARAARLKHALFQRKKLVLILDDVWECINLEKVGVGGCKWMMTTRSLKVCQEMNCQERIHIKPLGEEEGWKLFLKILQQDSTLALGDPQVREIAKGMVDICAGLPLGIISLARAASGLTDIQEWRHAQTVLKDFGYEWMEENVFRVLKYSFDRLDPNDQRCFLYCSLYPQDREILRDELVRNFISEKLVVENKSRTAQLDEAQSIVTRLVKVSLLESVSDEFVKMHDLVRGMAHMIAKGKNMVIKWTNNVEELPLMTDETDCMLIDDQFQTLEGIEQHNLELFRGFGNVSYLILIDDQFQTLEGIEQHNLKEFRGVVNLSYLEPHLPSILSALRSPLRKNIKAAAPSSIFSSLKFLTISHYDMMNKLGLPLSIFEKLEAGCQEIKEVVAAEDDALLFSLPNLKSLTLY